MTDQKRAKWILGGSGVILSALMLSQFSPETPTIASEIDAIEKNYTEQEVKQMSKREKELANLDWTNFEIVTAATQQQTSEESDRTTKES